MAEKKKKLNKGLDAIFGGDITSLIDDIEHNTPESSQEKIKLDEIRPNPYQPRKVFDEQALNELALSIQEHGIFQPVILKKSVQGYEIVAGERRCRAARMAHLEEVPAIIVDFSDQQMMEIALLENIQREDLNAIEEAQAYQTMMEKLKLTQNELAKRIGKSRTHITNTLRLLNLPEKIQEYVLDGSLSMGHASIAPSVARIPQLISPPSNAGPAEQAQLIIKSEFPKTSSPLVPRSINSENSGLFQIILTSVPAVISPPT